MHFVRTRGTTATARGSISHTQFTLFRKESEVSPGTLERSGHTTQHPDLGPTAWYTVHARDKTAPRGAWQHTALPVYAQELLGRVAFAWPAMDAFFEEDERIMAHAVVSENSTADLADPWHFSFMVRPLPSNSNSAFRQDVADAEQRPSLQDPTLVQSGDCRVPDGCAPDGNAS